MFGPQFHMTALAATLRSRLSIQDGFIVVATLCAGALFALEYEFFENVDHLTSREKRVSVREFFALAGLLIVSLIVFSYRRLQQQKREFTRRLAAEVAAHAAQQEAMRDPLTGLPNRRALMQAMSVALRDPDSGEQHALVLLDLTGFKAINDRFGHPAGDRLLETIAARMQSVAGRDNLVARLGGDEFAVLCPCILHTADARALAGRLVEAIAVPIEIDGHSHRVGAGAGLALFPQDAKSDTELMRRADTALYQAKAREHSAVHSCS